MVWEKLFVLLIKNGGSGPRTDPDSAALPCPLVMLLFVCVLIYRTVWLWCAYPLQPQTMAPGGQPLSSSGLVRGCDWLHIIISRFTGTNTCSFQTFDLVTEVGLWNTFIERFTLLWNTFIESFTLLWQKCRKSVNCWRDFRVTQKHIHDLVWNETHFCSSSHQHINIKWWALGI